MQQLTESEKHAKWRKSYTKKYKIQNSIFCRVFKNLEWICIDSKKKKKWLLIMPQEVGWDWPGKDIRELSEVGVTFCT